MRRRATSILSFVVGLFFIASSIKMIHNLETYPRDEVNLAYEFGKAAKEVAISFVSGWKDN